MQWQGLGDEVHHLLEDLALDLGDLTRTEAMVFHLLGGVIHPLQAFANQRVGGVVLFNFRMDEVVVVVKLGCFAEKHVLHAGLESVFDPFQAAEKDDFDRAGVVGEPCGGAGGSWRTHELHIANGADELVVNQVIVHLRHLVDLALVDIAERELVEHIHEGEHLQFLAQDFRLFRPDAFQVADVGLQQVDFHW